MKLHEECGIFGCIVKDNKAFEYIKYGLSMLQHRGQESAGITVCNEDFYTVKDVGLVKDVFKNVESIGGNIGIGHVRYSTQGLSDKLHAQPFSKKDIAICHNGNIILSKNDISLSDTEFILNKLIDEINKKPEQWQFEDITSSLIKNFSQGAYSLLIALPKRIIGIKDPYGFRPLMFCIAKEGYFLSSEDCAFNTLNIEKIIEIHAGEYIEITEKGYDIKKYCDNKTTKQCVFEHIYFADPTSNIFAKNVYETRLELGRFLAKEDDVNADVVVPVMDSGLAAAIGYCEVSKIPLHLGLKKNKPLRSFIQPTNFERKKAVMEKYTVIKNVIEGKRVILVDDSIVRGTTMQYLTSLLKDNGAKEVHIRLSAPPIINTCSWGIDIPDKDELLFPKYKDNIQDFLGCDSVRFISFKNFKEIFTSQKWCYNCFKL